MTPRTFHNILTGRKHEKDRRDAEWKRTQFMHEELVLILSRQYMKQGDWNRACAELSGKASDKPVKKAKRMTPEEVKAFLESQNKTK